MDQKKEPMTLRKLCEMLEPEYLDAELMIRVYDGHRNAEHCTPPRDLWGLPRSPAVASTGEPARLAINVSLDGYRLVKERKR